MRIEIYDDDLRRSPPRTRLNDEVARYEDQGSCCDWISQVAAIDALTKTGHLAAQFKLSSRYRSRTHHYPYPSGLA